MMWFLIIDLYKIFEVTIITSSVCIVGITHHCIVISSTSLKIQCIMGASLSTIATLSLNYTIGATYFN